VKERRERWGVWNGREVVLNAPQGRKADTRTILEENLDHGPMIQRASVNEECSVCDLSVSESSNSALFPKQAIVLESKFWLVSVCGAIGHRTSLNEKIEVSESVKSPRSARRLLLC